MDSLLVDTPEARCVRFLTASLSGKVKTKGTEAALGWVEKLKEAKLPMPWGEHMITMETIIKAERELHQYLRNSSGVNSSGSSNSNANGMSSTTDQAPLRGAMIINPMMAPPSSNDRPVRLGNNDTSSNPHLPGSIPVSTRPQIISNPGSARVSPYTAPMSSITQHPGNASINSTAAAINNRLGSVSSTSSIPARPSAGLQPGGSGIGLSRISPTMQPASGAHLKVPDQKKSSDSSNSDDDSDSSESSSIDISSEEDNAYNRMVRGGGTRPATGRQQALLDKREAIRQQQVQQNNVLADIFANDMAKSKNLKLSGPSALAGTKMRRANPTKGGNSKNPFDTMIDDSESAPVKRTRVTKDQKSWNDVQSLLEQKDREKAMQAAHVGAGKTEYNTAPIIPLQGLDKLVKYRSDPWPMKLQEALKEENDRLKAENIPSTPKKGSDPKIGSDSKRHSDCKRGSESKAIGERENLLLSASKRVSSSLSKSGNFDIPLTGQERKKLWVLYNDFGQQIEEIQRDIVQIRKREGTFEKSARTKMTQFRQELENQQDVLFKNWQGHVCKMEFIYNANPDVKAKFDARERIMGANIPIAMSTMNGANLASGNAMNGVGSHNKNTMNELGIQNQDAPLPGTKLMGVQGEHLELNVLPIQSFGMRLYQGCAALFKSGNASRKFLGPARVTEVLAERDLVHLKLIWTKEGYQEYLKEHRSEFDPDIFEILLQNAYLDDPSGVTVGGKGNDNKSGVFPRSSPNASETGSTNGRGRGGVAAGGRAQKTVKKTEKEKQKAQKEKLKKQKEKAKKDKLKKAMKKK